MPNRELKKTLRKLEENPDYQFHSEWHKQRHLQARKDESSSMWIEELIYAAAAAVMLIVTLICLNGG